MSLERNTDEQGAHFGVGHMCAGCQFAMSRHTGCVVEGSGPVKVFGGKVVRYKAETEGVVQNDPPSDLGTFDHNKEGINIDDSCKPS